MKILKTFPVRLDEVAQQKGIHPADIEVWFADEARAGQKNKITGRWARRGTRPGGAERPAHRLDLYLRRRLPQARHGRWSRAARCNIATMNVHLAEMASAVASGAHAILLLDQAAWHLSERLVVPTNITLMPLPAKCLELSPVENIWQFIRDNWLSNRDFKNDADILDHCFDAWDKLVDQPWRVRFLGLRDRAMSFDHPVLVLFRPRLTNDRS